MKGKAKKIVVWSPRVVPTEVRVWVYATDMRVCTQYQANGRWESNRFEYLFMRFCCHDANQAGSIQMDGSTSRSAGLGRTRLCHPWGREPKGGGQVPDQP